MIDLDTAGILKILATAAGIMVAIQGVKNLFPQLFEKIPNFARILTAVAALIAALIPCLQGGLNISCVITALLTFLGAVGIYHSVAQSGGAVNPPLPPEPEAEKP